MADLDPLIRFRRHTVDEKQKVLSDFYRKAETLENKKAQLDERLEAERQALGPDAGPEMVAYFGRFAQNIRRDIDRINAELKKLEVRIQIAQDEVRAAFAEMKKVEIVQKQRMAAEKAAADKKETAILDEAGLEAYRRKE